MASKSNSNTNSVQTGREPIVSCGFLYLRVNQHGSVLNSSIERPSYCDTGSTNITNATPGIMGYLVGPCLGEISSGGSAGCNWNAGEIYVSLQYERATIFSRTYNLSRQDRSYPTYTNYTSTVTISIPDEIAVGGDYTFQVSGNTGASISVSGSPELGIVGNRIRPTLKGNYFITAALSGTGNYPSVSVSIDVKVINKQFITIGIEDLVVGVLTDLDLNSLDSGGSPTGLTEFSVTSNQEGIQFIQNKAISTKQGVYTITIIQEGNEVYERAELQSVLIVGINNLSPVLISSGGSDVKRYLIEVILLMKLLVAYKAMRGFYRLEEI